MRPLRRLTNRSRTNTRSIKEQIPIGIINTPPRRSKSVTRVAPIAFEDSESVSPDVADGVAASVTIIGDESSNEDEFTEGVETDLSGVSNPFWTGFESALKSWAVEAELIVNVRQQAVININVTVQSRKLFISVPRVSSAAGLESKK
jgi:hypothetical protein